MKTRGKRIALLLSLCLLLASLVTVLFVSAEEDAGDVTVAYANGTTETYAVGETITPIEVPKDFARYDESGDAYVYTVEEGAAWSFVFGGKTLTNLTVTDAMAGKTVSADVPGTMGDKKVFYTIREEIVDITVPEELRGEFFIYGYDEASLITYLSRDNVGDGTTKEPRYRYLRQRDNSFYITLYTDLYPTKFDPRWGAAGKEWELEWKGVVYKVQDRTWRYDMDEHRFEADGVTPAPVGTSARVFFNLNGHTLEIGSSESFHFGAMACTPYSMRLYFYSTTPGAVFSGAKSEAVFYSDDDSTVYVGELNSGDTKYGQNLSVYGKMVAHVNYGGGVWLWGGRYYQVAMNHAFINISHRLYEIKNCEFHLSDQSEALFFFNGGQYSNWSTSKSGVKIENCKFYVNQYGTKLLREVSSRSKYGVETEAVEIANKYPLSFKNCSFYGMPIMKTSAYLNMKYEGACAYSVSADANLGTLSEPAYISYLANPTETDTLYDMNGIPFTVTVACDILPLDEVFCVRYKDDLNTYWQVGAKPFAYDQTVVTETERYVESEGEYIGLPEVLEAGKVYPTSGIKYNKKTIFAFTYVTKNGVEGYGLVGNTPEETGLTFAQKLGSLSDVEITLYADLTLTKNADFGTRGYVHWDMNGYKVTIAENAAPMGAMHRIGDGMELTLYSSRPGAVYENLSSYPIFSLSHGGKGGTIMLGDYEYALGSTYDGQNVTYISNGSFFAGNPLAEGAEAVAMFRAKNVNFVFVGSGVAFACANNVALENSKIVMDPAVKGASPIVFSTRPDAEAVVSCGSTSVYAPDGVNASAFACLNNKGQSVNGADFEQQINFNNAAFYNVSASVVSSVEKVTFSYGGSTGFTTVEALGAFYEGGFPSEKLIARTSAKFYIDGEIKALPLWTCAAPNYVATVTFNSGKANLGSFTEDWVKGSLACHEGFVVDGIFAYSYGTREVGSSSNILTAGCTNLVPGALRVNLSLKGEPKLNLWVPMDSPILSLTVNGTKVDIAPTLDYKGTYYIVQFPITYKMLMQSATVVIQTENYKETLQLPLSSYVSGLLDDEGVSAEEKRALYALMELASLASGKENPTFAPSGYQEQKADKAEAPAYAGAITSIAFDAKNSGAILTVSGISGTAITLVTENGTRVEGVIENGECKFTDIPVYLLLGELTIECGEDSYIYSVANLKTALAELKRGTEADILQTYIYYADKFYAALGA